MDIPDPISEDQCPARPSLSTLWAAHGVLMTAGWGVMLPIAALVAHTLRHHEPLWFHVHRAAACAGLLLATCGWAIALAKFGGLNISLAGTPGNRLTTSHAVVGMVVMILGLLQPVNAVVRPKAGSEVYAVFRRIHSAAGWVASIGGGANVVSGLLLFWHRAGRCTGIWPFILYGSWVFAFFLGWILLHFRHRKKNERAKKRKHSIYSRTDDDRHAGGESTETEWRNLDSSREYRLWLQSIHHIDMQGDPPEPSAGNNWYAGGNRVSEVMLPVLPTSTATCAQADQPVAEGTPGEHQEQRTSAPDLRDKDIGDARELRISRELTFADSSL